MVSLSLRHACIDDAPQIEALIKLSVRTLQRDHYTTAQIESALRAVFGVDRQLIEDQTYLVIEDKSQIVACGGWSRRRTLFGSDAFTRREEGELIPGHDAAKIRAFFVHPQWARQGLGGKLLSSCEQAATAAGFKALELGATLTGEPLYARYGFRAVERLEVPLSDGQISLPIVRMTKSLT